MRHVAGTAVFLLSVLLSSSGTEVFAAPGRNAQAEVRNNALVDINRASLSELRTLPGIHDAYAAAILRNRPYRNKAQLLSKQIIPEAAYEKIKNKIIAKQ